MAWKCEKLMFLISILTYGMAVGVSEADVVGLWDLDFGIANDSFGNRNGELVGNPTWEEGRVGGALMFDGDDYIMLPDEFAFDLPDAITIACWIRVTEFDEPQQTIISKGTWKLKRSSAGNTVAFDCVGVEPIDREKGGHRGVHGSVNVNDGKWHHVAGVYNGAEIQLYVDGLLDASLDVSGKIANSVYPVCIGRDPKPTGSAKYFKGLIDDVAIFDGALAKDELTRLYEAGGASFIPRGYMAGLLEETEVVFKKLKPRDSVAFLEKKITEHREWKVENKETFGPRDEKMSSDIYYLLATAKEAANFPKEDVIAAYKQSVSNVLYRTKYVPASFLWLFANVPAEDYVNSIAQFFRRTNVPSYNIHLVTRQFESKENWDAFSLFMDSVFSSTISSQRSFLYAEVISKSLRQDGVWVAKFEEYCRTRPELTTYLFRKEEEEARKHITLENFGKAAKIYRDIVGRCGPNQRKTTYEFNVCECLFNARQCESALGELDRFIKTYKATNKLLVPKAIILKGQAYVHLGDIDRATDIFFALIVEHPQATQVPDATFFMGYCFMLQGKFNEATEAFSLVVKDYPESSFTSKARLYLTRIEDMTE